MPFNFAELIRRDMTVRDIRNRHPETRDVLERYGVRAPCWECSLAEVAHRSGVGVEELLQALNQAVFGQAHEKA
jgi:hypothetical protein